MKYLLVLCCAISISTVAEVPSDAVQFKLKRISDGDEVNLEMVCDGHAWWYERYAKKASDYKQCQEDAQKNKRGLWAEDDPVAPWDWRRR
jgi:endonuclease YncB( thermonuclease family)